MKPDQDPGWQVSPMMLVPILRVRHMKRMAADGTPPLVLLRHVFVSFVLAIVLFGIVLFSIGEPEGLEGEPATGQWIAGVAVLGVLMLALVRVLDRPLRCEDLAASYRSRFFFRIALSESVALVGFVGAFLAPSPWVYVVGAAFTLSSFWMTAPTRAHILRDQAELRASGCVGSIYAVLGG